MTDNIELKIMELKSKVFDISRQQEILQMQYNKFQQMKLPILRQLADLETEMAKQADMKKPPEET